MMRHPVACDIDASTEPYPVVALEVVEKARQRRRTPGSPDESAVQTDRHHFGRDLSLGVEDAVLTPSS
jgi:hypothetical protein